MPGQACFSENISVEVRQSRRASGSSRGREGIGRQAALRPVRVIQRNGAPPLRCWRPWLSALFLTDSGAVRPVIPPGVDWLFLHYTVVADLGISAPQARRLSLSPRGNGGWFCHRHNGEKSKAGRVRYQKVR